MPKIFIKRILILILISLVLFDCASSLQNDTNIIENTNGDSSKPDEVNSDEFKSDEENLIEELPVIEEAGAPLLRIYQDNVTIESQQIYDFGTKPVNEFELSAEFMISNEGTSTFLISDSKSIYISGENQSSFYVSVLSSTSVAIDGSAIFKINFKPIETGRKNAIINIIDIEAGDLLYHFNLTGLGIYDFKLRENAEAEYMALDLSGELYANENIYIKILNDLKAIRTNYGQLYPKLNEIKYRNESEYTSEILLKIKESYKEQFWRSCIENDQEGIFAKFYEKNKIYSIEDIVCKGRLSGSYTMKSIYRLNESLLSGIYDEFFFVDYTLPNYLRWDNSTICVFRDEVPPVSYIFRNAYGDCLSGCIYQDYYYFIMGTEPEFLGHYEPVTVGEITVISESPLLINIPTPIYNEPPDWWPFEKNQDCRGIMTIAH